MRPRIVRRVRGVVVGTLVLAGMVLVLVTRATPDLPGIALAVSMLLPLTLGFGVMNAFLFLAFPAWERIWTILTRPLFIISGVFFLFEDVPAELREYLWYNPLFHVTGQMRSAFYATYDAAYVSVVYPLMIGAGLTVLGLLLLFRYADGMLHK